MRIAAKHGLVAAVVAGVLGLAAVPAQATLVASSPVMTATNVGPVELNGVAMCLDSHLTVENPVSGPPGQGGTADLMDATFSGCTRLGSYATVTANFVSLPWGLEFRPFWDTVDVSGIDLTVTSAFLSCGYMGGLTGDWSNDDTATFSAASGLSKVSGGFLCPSSPTFEGEYRLDWGDTIVVS
jgi:hypothetical protein